MKASTVVAVVTGIVLLAFATELNAKNLGPLPDNAKSEYVETLGCGVNMSWPDDQPVFQISIFLKIAENVPAGALLEAEFSNLADPAHSLTAEAVVGAAELEKQQVMLMSPKTKDSRCGDVTATVRVYRDATNRELLGTHTQPIRSTIDSRECTSLEKCFMRLAKKGQVCAD